MITITHKKYDFLPFLELIREDNKDKVLPLILFYHGWAWDGKVLTQAYEIARKDFRVIIPEALFHGEREDGPIESHQAQFWEVIKHSLTEFPKLVKYYSKLGLIQDDQVAVGGLSMGGITSCALFTIYPWIKAAICLEGTPAPLAFAHVMIDKFPGIGDIPTDYIQQQLDGIDKFDLSLDPAKIAGRDLHFWHGTADPIVPYDLTAKFFDDVKGKTYAQNVTMSTTQGASHKVPMDITRETVEKFEEYFK